MTAATLAKSQVGEDVEDDKIKYNLALSFQGLMDKSKTPEVFNFDDIFKKKRRMVLYPDDPLKVWWDNYITM